MATTTFKYSTTTTRYYCYTSTSTSNKLYYSNAFIKKLGDATTSGNNKTGFVVHTDDDWGFAQYGSMYRATRIAPTGTVNGYTFSQLSEASLSQVYVTINSRMNSSNRAVAPYFGPCIGSGLQITPSVSVIDSRNGSNTSRSGCFAIQAGTSNGGSSAYNGLNTVYLKTPEIPAGSAFSVGARSTTNTNYGYVAGATVTVIINNPTLTVSAGTGGSVSITSSTGSTNTAESITAIPATGYKFSSWSLSPTDSSKEYYGSIDSDSSETVTYTYGLSDSTLTANFSQKQYTFHFNANEPSGTASYIPPDASPQYGTESYCSWANCQLNNYDFLGWFDDAIEGNQVYDRSGKAYPGTGYWDSNNLCIYDGIDGETIQLYAHWQVQDSSDIHYYNGSTLVDATIYYYNGSALVEADIYYYDGTNLNKCT